MSRRTSSTLNSSVFPKPCTGDSPSKATLLPHNSCTTRSISLLSTAGFADWPVAVGNATPMQIDKETRENSKRGLLKENAADRILKRERDLVVSISWKPEKNICTQLNARIDYFGNCNKIASLAVLYARLYIRVSRIDKRAQRCGIYVRSRFQLHMAHVLAGPLQQTSRIRQLRAAKESHIHVRGEYVDVAKG